MPVSLAASSSEQARMSSGKQPLRKRPGSSSDAGLGPSYKGTSERSKNDAGWAASDPRTLPLQS